MLGEVRPGSRIGSNSRRPSLGQSPPPSAGGNGRSLPACVGIGARQELHEGEQVPQMFAVMTATTAEDGALIGGRVQLRLVEDGGENRAILFLELARIRRYAGPD